jgi:hypothetical protein
MALAGSLLAASLLTASSPAGRRAARPAAAPLDFSGVWELDAAMSVNVPTQMKEAVLSVTQKGNRIWISPVASGKASMIMAEEIVADGRPYEKALGPAGKGIVTANWSEDRQSLRIEVKAGGAEGQSNPSAIQRSIWKLSSDKRVWVRETVSVSQGPPRAARLVFRRRAAETIPTPKPARSSRRKRAETPSAPGDRE